MAETSIDHAASDTLASDSATLPKPRRRRRRTVDSTAPDEAATLEAAEPAEAPKRAVRKPRRTKAAAEPVEAEVEPVQQALAIEDAGVDASEEVSERDDESERGHDDHHGDESDYGDEGDHGDEGDDSDEDDLDDDSDDKHSLVVETRKSDPARVSQHLAKFSDRAIQRVTGGNAFLRGRLYARRGHVNDLWTHGSNAKCVVQVKADVTYEPKVTLTDEEQWVSDCTCPGFRGPTNHCKHVAALMVALRDRERPPKPKHPDAAKKKSKEKANGKQEVKAHSPQTVSVGGKRRSRRRRRRGTGPGGEVEMLSVRELGIASPPVRGGLDAWMPSEESLRHQDLEFRMQVRAASIAVTPVLAGTRSAVAISDLLGAFNAIPTSMRPLLRALERHTSRSTPATAEIRGEDAAEVLRVLKGHRVLLEPASMELRFADEPLRPRLELDQANAKAVRMRVVFEGASRRFSLSNGNWFEGTPGWHIDTTEGVARPVTDSVTPAWLQRLYRSPALVHPASDLPYLLTEFIPKVASSLGADLPDLSQIADLVDATPEFALDMDGDIIEARASLDVAYGDNEFPVPAAGFPSPLEFLPPEAEGMRPRVVRRDVGAEMAAVQRLMNQGFAADEETESLIARGDDAVAFWTEGIAELPAEWEKRVPDDLARVTVRSTPVGAQMRVSSGVDWLSLDMSFATEGVAVDADELRMCLEHGRHLVKLADGSYAPVRAEDVGEILERMAEIYAGGSKDKLPLTQAGRVQDLLRLVGAEANVTPAAKELFSKLGNVEEIPAVPKPRNLKVKTFRDYQKRGFSWLAFLHECGTGGILADDMGLGKTLQTIALLLWAKNKHKRKISLVVAPTSVVPNWQLEIEKFAPKLTTVLWQGADRQDKRVELDDADVMITSYALLRRDEEFLQSLDLRYVILDEAQHIKNPLSATARAAKRLESERRLALTGTPIENRLSEIWSIFDFVSPGLLGTLKSFEERYSKPIDRGDEESAAKLRTIIRPLVMRRTKAEVAPELPEKIQQEIVVPMADEQSKLYKQMLKQVRDSVLSEVESKGIGRAQIQILAALTRMRQVACDPRLTNLNGEWSDETSGKLQALREIVEEAIAGGHRMLIFSQFVSMLTLIRSMMEEVGATYEYLDGSTKDRQERVNHFNNDESVNAFLISLKAGGTGLNLTGADTVVHFDPWWNPAVEDQATDRAHRIGQEKVVTVYRLIARDSVEEKILKLSEKKRELVSNVLTTESTPLKGLTKADIDDLFS
ncbi:MAG: SNF2 helicase associated domain-containing protein [Sandaracinaceae bacterium]|nr:SNF2 helicase associated domain-containing protein [Sandaracinaceae bacterium]